MLWFFILCAYKKIFDASQLCSNAALTLLYDEARFRHKLGLAHTAQTFAQKADETLIDLRQQIDIKGTRGAFDSYVSCIEKYFLPYFGDRRLEELTHKDIVDFELWRNR